MTAVSVTQLNRFVKGLLSRTEQLQNMAVRGEISNFTRHHVSGHLYFTLKDKTAAVKCVMFAGYAKAVKFQPKNGMSVIVTGSVSLYERDGSYQLSLEAMEPEGIGALHLAFMQTKERLEKEGLLDPKRKRPLPPYPEAIGIVTSKGAAALQDMLNILERRYPMAEVILYPAQVQGEGAAQTLCDGLAALNADGRSQVIIIGRGGGSMEDLWAFNDEGLARAIVNSNIPVISAVGHETDFTIADFAADVRAPTPSAAAELATPNTPDLLQYIDGLSATGAKVLAQRIHNGERRLQDLRSRLLSPEKVLEQKAAQFRLLQQSLRQSVQRILEARTHRLAMAAQLLEAKSPLRLLSAGYSITTKKGKALTDVTELQNWDILETRLAGGIVYSAVTEIVKKEVGTVGGGKPDGGR